MVGIPPTLSPSDVRVIWDVLKYKTDSDIKEVIILDVFPKIHLLLYMNLSLFIGGSVQ